MGNAITRRGSPASRARASTSEKIESGESRRTRLPHWRQESEAVRANSSFRWSLISVIVPTVEREVRTGFVWSMAIAGGTPSIASTCGLSIRSRNCRA
jgi:hypothetical protein